MKSVAILLLAQLVMGHGDATAPAGTYCGRAMSGGQMVPTTTTIRRSGDGSFGGEYDFVEGNKSFHGTLSRGQALNNNVWRFTWVDKFGSGALIMDFGKGGGAFAGFWGPEGRLPYLPWNGAPCGDVS